MSQDEERNRVKERIPNLSRRVLRREPTEEAVDEFDRFMLSNLEAVQTCYDNITAIRDRIDDTFDYRYLARQLEPELDYIDTLTLEIFKKWDDAYGFQDYYKRGNTLGFYLKPEFVTSMVNFRALSLEGLEFLEVIQRTIEQGGYHMKRNYDHIITEWRLYKTRATYTLTWPPNYRGGPINKAHDTIFLCDIL